MALSGKTRDIIGETDHKMLQVSSVASHFDGENLEIYENTNGQIMIRNLSQVTIRNMDELYLMLREGVEFINCESCSTF